MNFIFYIKYGLLKALLLFGLCFMGYMPVSGQSVQLIITSTKTTDRTFHKKDKLYLEVKGERHQMIYTLDTSTEKLTTKKYLTESYFSVRDVDTLIKQKTKKRYRPCRNHMSMLDYETLLMEFRTDTDSLEKNDFIQHISHYYVNFYVDFVQGTDTLHFWKTLPFDTLTPWFTNLTKGEVLNHKADEELYHLLPRKFLLREKLIPVYTSSK